MIIIKTTSNSKAILKTISIKLLNNNLIVCANILEGISSIYKWKNKIVEDKEHIMLLKTLESKKKEVYKLIKDNHNYDIPEIVTFQTSDVEKKFYNWIKETLQND